MAAANQELAAEDLSRLSEAALAEDTARLRRYLDGLEGQWLRRVAAIDACGAAGADQGQEVRSTAAWLRKRLRMSTSAVRSAVRTARALFRGPLTETAAALTAGDISSAHAKAVADGTQDLPDHVKLEAEPVLLEAARRLDPPQLGRLVGHLVQVADPDSAELARDHRHERRGLWLSPTFDGMVAVDGLLEPEAGNTVLAALEPLARPADAHDTRKGGQRTADALTDLARRALEAGRLPQAGSVRPQLLVTVDLDSLLGHPGAVGGELGWAGPLDREACRRLACDGAVTRVLVGRQPAHDHPAGGSVGHDPNFDHSPTADHDLSQPVGLQKRLQKAMALLPPLLGGAPSQPLDLGRRPGWFIRPSVPRWRCVTAAARSRAAIARWPGGRRIICGTG